MENAQKEKTRLNALKSKPYGNCKVYDMQGDLLFRCGRKKINWYLKRNLADIISDANGSISIRLTFEPAGKGNQNDIFLLSDKENKCVACGVEEELSKHHVVPRCYRTWFPVESKEHGSHDVLPLCLDCHSSYEVFADELKKTLSEIYDAPLHGIISKERLAYNKAIGYARSLHLHGYIIPLDRMIEIHEYIMEVTGITNLTDEAIEELSNQELMSMTTFDSKPHGKIVVEKIKDQDEFVRMWRKHFIDNLRPEYLPKGWSIDYSIE